MWEFPNGRVHGDPVQGLAKALKTGYGLRLLARRDGSIPIHDAMGIVHHTYTHFGVTVHVFKCELPGRSKVGGLKWVSLNELEEYPMGKVDRQIAQIVFEKLGGV
jgi:8-oxo-dGTP pyrophosphatase MutT (NUDIX family)